jgi:hypothetical protein
LSNRDYQSGGKRARLDFALRVPRLKSDIALRFLKTGVFLAPFHPLDENPLLALDFLALDGIDAVLAGQTPSNLVRS